MAEVWKRVPAYRLLGVPAGYEASSLGRVRSVDRTLSDGREAGGVVLAPTRDKDGYWRVKLGRKLVPVHILVLLAFHGPPEGRHLNDDKDDNTPAKLAWGSRKENERDKRRNKARKEEAIVSSPELFATTSVSPVTRGY